MFNHDFSWRDFTPDKCHFRECVTSWQSAYAEEYIRSSSNSKKGGHMTLMKKSNFPFFWNEKWLTDFFDNGRFFDSDMMKMSANPMPAVNIVENEKDFVIELAAPGLTKKDFNVTVENGVLTISAEKEMEKEDARKNYTRKEYSFEQFERSFTLPENVTEDKIKAHYEDGILKLELAKKALATLPPKKEIVVA